MVSILMGTSLDGFNARSNGDLDFLPPGGGERGPRRERDDADTVQWVWKRI